jgi:hypothetical protein
VPERTNLKSGWSSASLTNNHEPEIEIGGTIEDSGAIEYVANPMQEGSIEQHAGAMGERPHHVSEGGIAQTGSV